ncbi:MAG: hypothetical protein HRT66_02015 [Flavobacteriaceae bacterium]|nr:hypothetical protein [Flavobacteriaceae bacterium]
MVLHCNAPTRPKKTNTHTNPDKNKFTSKISPKPGSISVAIRSYKSVLTRDSRLILPDFSLQRNYYDNIIRNTKSFNQISTYIINNPTKWDDDMFYIALEKVY